MMFTDISIFIEFTHSFTFLYQFLRLKKGWYIDEFQILLFFTRSQPISRRWVSLNRFRNKRISYYPIFYSKNVFSIIWGVCADVKMWLPLYWICFTHALPVNISRRNWISRFVCAGKFSNRNLYFADLIIAFIQTRSDMFGHVHLLHSPSSPSHSLLFSLLAP